MSSFTKDSHNRKLDNLCFEPSGALTVYMKNQSIDVNVKNSNIGITGFVGITGPVNIYGNVGVTGFVGITGTSDVNVKNWPNLQGITGYIGITGTSDVNVKNWPNLQGITGSINVLNTAFGVTGPVDVHLYGWKGTGNAMELVSTDKHNHLMMRLTNDDETKLSSFDNDGGINTHITNTQIGVTGFVGITGNPQVTVSNSAIGITGYIGITGNPTVAVSNSIQGDVLDTFGQAVSTSITCFPADSNSVFNKLCVFDEFLNSKITSDDGYTGSIKVSVMNPLQITNVGVTGSVSISNIVGITGGYLAVQPVSGTVGVSGSVSISNIVGITGTVNLGPTGNTIKIDSSNNLVKISDGTDTATVTSTLNETNIKGVDTNAYLTAFYRNGNANSNLTSVNPTGADGGVHALDTYSYISGLSDVLGASNRIPIQISATYGGSNSINSLDTYIRNEATTNFYGKAGINMYNIYPKVKIYTLQGLSSAGAVNSMLANYGTSTTFSAVNWGKNALKTFYASMSAGGSTKYLRFEYVDSSGDFQTSPTIGIGTGSGTTPVLSNIIGINKIYFANASQSGANNQTFATVDGLYVSTTSGSTTPSYYGGFYYANWNSTYTCPNNRVAVLKNFSFYASSGIDVYGFICDPNGGRRMVIQVMNASNFVYQIAELQINAGETLFFGTGNNSTALSKQVVAQIYEYEI